eukprot:m.80174 g.80174  ORF g.80174 m.80174 type:complete len:365 (+) comp14195_c0_seq1:317-1411(+)
MRTVSSLAGLCLRHSRVTAASAACSSFLQQRRFGSSLRLSSRGVVKVEGEDAAQFLQGLVTNDINLLKDNSVQFAMLLNPKGRVLVDLFVYRINQQTFYLDCDRTLTPNLENYMKKFLLRSKVSTKDVSDDIACVVGIDAPADRSVHKLIEECDPRVASFDPYCKRLTRGLVEVASAPTTTDETPYHQIRIKMGLGEGAIDHEPSKALPLNCNLDFLNGVSWTKGCYLGQELTARTHHTGVVRKRLMPLKLDRPDLDVGPSTFVARLEDGKPVGEVRSQLGSYALAMIRMAEAKDAQLTLISPGGPEAEIYCNAKLIWPKWWPSGVKESIQAKAPSQGGHENGEGVHESGEEGWDIPTSDRKLK